MSTVGAYFRLVRAGWILVREGVIAALPGEQFQGMPLFMWKAARVLSRRRSGERERSERLAKAVDRLGPSYVKLGQFLATRPDVVGHDMALDLAGLQDRMSTFRMRRHARKWKNRSANALMIFMYGLTRRWRLHPSRRFTLPK